MQPNFASCTSDRKATAAERHLPLEHCLVHLTRFTGESFRILLFLGELYTVGLSLEHKRRRLWLSCIISKSRLNHGVVCQFNWHSRGRT